MLYLESFGELVELLKEGALDESCHHASYVSTAEDITALLSEVNRFTNMIPDYIDFTNFDGCEYYNLSFDYEDGEFRYSISPALDEETDEFYPDYGLCLVDECVPSYFEEEYKEYGQFNDNYESPIRVCWGEEPEEDYEDDPDCEKCTYKCDAPCCKKNEPKTSSSPKVEEKTKVDTDDNGKVWGFTKSWKDNNSHFTYSYHSIDEDDVLELMKKFNISQF